MSLQKKKKTCLYYIRSQIVIHLQNPIYTYVFIFKVLKIHTPKVKYFKTEQIYTQTSIGHLNHISVSPLNYTKLGVRAN